MTADSASVQVPLRAGPPTREELNVHYPAHFTWEQLKVFVNSGDLGLLKRDKALQKRYEIWAAEIKLKHGSMVNYLQNYRLSWGARDSLSLLKSTVEEPDYETTHELRNDAPCRPYFTLATPKHLISIISNDWPYSVPNFIEHSLVWTKLPIFHPALIHPSIAARIEQDGIWGFTGLDHSPPSSPSALHACLPALSDWGMTLEKMICTPRGTVEEESLVNQAGEGVSGFIRQRWTEDTWETAWFVNPPRLQSVKGLAHIHVFACRKHPAHN